MKQTALQYQSTRDFKPFFVDSALSFKVPSNSVLSFSPRGIIPTCRNLASEGA